MQKEFKILTKITRIYTVKAENEKEARGIILSSLYSQGHKPNEPIEMQLLDLVIDIPEETTKDKENGEKKNEQEEKPDDKGKE